MAKFNLALFCFTDGRKGLLEQTLPSFNRHLDLHKGYLRWGQRLLIDDSADPEYDRHLHNLFDQEFDEIIFHSHRLGFCASIADAWSRIKMEIDFIFHLEDDFILQKDIRLMDMITLLCMNTDLAQVALVRQPWNEEEKKAGGLIQRWRDLFSEYQLRYRLPPPKILDRYSWAKNIDPVEYPAAKEVIIPWLKHQQYFTTNPCLYPRRILDQKWVVEPQCEGKFGQRLKAKGWSFAYLGAADDPPTVIHIGDKRIGGGY